MNWHLSRGWGTGDIEDDDCCTRILDIGGDEGVESLLSSRIPQLHPQTFILNIDCFRYEIDSNCWLPYPKNTCSFPVKLSNIKRLIMEVLPTDWSPSNTILHFIAGLFYISNLYILSLTTYHHPKNHHQGVGVGVGVFFHQGQSKCSVSQFGY